MKPQLQIKLDEVLFFNYKMKYTVNILKALNDRLEVQNSN